MPLVGLGRGFDDEGYPGARSKNNKKMKMLVLLSLGAVAGVVLWSQRAAAARARRRQLPPLYHLHLDPP